jgi:SAM-dependent methyltransferase
MSLFNSPLSIEKAERLVSVLDVPENARALDAGCGRGEFLIRVIESTKVRGLGIDRDATCIAAAMESASRRIPGPLYEFREAEIESEPLEDDSFDLGICLGSTHAFGSGDAAYPNTISSLFRLVRPGGLILVGECYWKQTPDPEYLGLLGDPVGIYRSHAENIAFGESNGLIPLYAAVSSDDEWDHFEWSHHMHIERQAALHAGNPVWAEKLARGRQWSDGYLRWGRSTLGFGFYLFAKPLDTR